MIKKSECGQVLLLVITSLGIVLFTVLFIIAGAQLYFQNALYSLNSEKAMLLAEAGLDKALASLNATAGNYNGEGEAPFEGGSYEVVVTDKDAITKSIEARGYIPNKSNPKVSRKISMSAAKGTGISFSYGLLVGDGGIHMGNDATLNGSVYSNGSITGGENTKFTGDVWVAGSVSQTADQQNDCFGVNCQDYIFGKNVFGENRQDVAQSFKPAASGLLNKVSLKFKKTGSPANLTVRIMTDAGNKPNKNGILATGTLAANLVSSTYGFIDVTFDTTPNLNSNSTYWIMVHTPSLDSSNYWAWSNDLAQGYTRGEPKWAPNWQAGNPQWDTISGDLGFQTYMGGGTTSFSLSSSSTVDGNVHANTISGNMVISKSAYYQIIDPSVIVSGTKYPGSSDPPPAVFPISDTNISDWRNQAISAGSAGGSITGCPASLGPGVVSGSVSLSNGCNVKIFTPLLITGNVTIGNNTKFILDQSFGATSGMIIVEGQVIFGNGADIVGSGMLGSYLMLLITYNSQVSGNNALTIGNSSLSGILYVPYGKVALGNGSSFTEITAWKLEFGNAGTLTYNSGLASTFFSSGPQGAYSFVKGTYQVK